MEWQKLVFLVKINSVQEKLSSLMKIKQNEKSTFIYLNFGLKMQHGVVSMGHIQIIENGRIAENVHLENQLNVADAYGSSWSHSKIPSIENLNMQSLRNQCYDSIFHLTGGGRGKYRFS